MPHRSLSQACAKLQVSLSAHFIHGLLTDPASAEPLNTVQTVNARLRKKTEPYWLGLEGRRSTGTV